MAKKKAIKLAAASAVAASAFVAAAPAQTDAASNVAVEVSKAVTQMKKAYHTYSDVTATGDFAPIADVYKEYNAAKKAYANAKALVNKAGGADKDANLATLEDTYAEYIAKRVITYIDAYNYATTLQDKQVALEEALEDNNWDAAEEQYHAISYELKTRTVILDRVYGKSTRELLRGSFKADAQAARDSIQNEVTVKIYFDKAEGLLAEGKLEEAKAAMDHVADYVAKLDADTDFGAALLEKVEAAEKKYDELSVPKVESVSAINLKEVVVVFNKDVDTTTAGTTGNYTFANGSGVTVTNAKVEGKTVTLTVTGTSQQQSADLTVENVKVANGDVIAKSTKTVKFVDTVAPTVSSVTAAGPKTVKVKFSEPLQSAPTFSLNNGTISIVSTGFQAGDSEVTLTLGTAPAAGTYSLKVKDGLDYAGFKVDEVTKEFTFAVDTVAPTVSVKSATPTQIVLTFSEDVTGLTDNNVEFFHTYNGVNAYKAQKSPNGKELTLTFANPLPEGAFKLFLNYATDNGTEIADLWGNKVAEQTITGTVVSDVTAPTVTKVEASSNTAINVTFSEAVSGATTAANYEIKDASGKVVAINGQITNPSGNTYSIPVAALNGGSYTLTVKNIKDTSINQNKLADYSTVVTVKDIVPPTVTDLDTNTNGTQAQLLSAKKVKVVFSEVMDKASIENKLNYLFGGAALDSKVTVTAVDGNKAVVLDFTDATTQAQQTPTGATLQVLRVADAAGNPIAAASTVVAVPGQVSAPLFDKAEVTGKNSIKLYFKEVITSAQAADFLVAADGQNGTYAAAGSISNEVVDGKSVITLTTAQNLPTTAANVYVKTANTVNAENSFGSKVSLSATSAGDKYAPLATVATAVDNDGDTFVDRFTVQFTENLYVASVQDSDFTVEGYEVTGVSVNNDVVTLSVKEKTTNDLAATPKVTLVGTVEDADRNARTTQDALTAVAAQVGINAVNAQDVATDKAALTLASTVANGGTINLPSTGSNGTSIAWAVGTATDVNQTDNVPAAGNIANGVLTVDGDSTDTVVVTATITKGNISDTKSFTITVQ